MPTSNENGSFSWGWVIFIVLILWFFVGGTGCGNGYGRGGCGNSFTDAEELILARDLNSCNRVSNCEVEKQEILDTWSTQRLIDHSTNDIEKLLSAEIGLTRERLEQKIDFYGYENLKDQLAQERAKALALEGKLFSTEQFCALNNKIDVMYCGVAKSPHVYPVSYICPAAPTTTA